MDKKLALLDQYGKRISLGYNATTTKNSRLRPRTSIASEDDVLNSANRKKLVATTRDQTRNIALVAWMFRKHLDYVSQFTFHPMMKDTHLNLQLERLWRQYNNKSNCDIANRHSLSRITRLFESSKVIDGDCGLYKLSNGKIQGIEGSRIAKPDSMGTNKEIKRKDITEHGLVLNKYGGVEKYCIVKIENGRKVFDRLLPADKILFDGYYTRFDQTRGISPLAAAINTFQDLYESWEYQLIKAKLHAMFGIAIKSESVSSEGDGWDSIDMVTGNAPTASTLENGYEFEIKEGGMKLELEPGDSIDTIESKTPSAEFRDYTELMARIGMLSLDIPFSFYDSRQSSYSAMKQDRVEYENSSKAKQESNRDILLELADWKHQQWINEGLISGVNSASDIIYDWRSIGRPWIEEVKEIDAASRRIATGLSSRQREAKKRNEDFFEIANELEAEEQLIEEKGLNIVSGMPGQTTILEREKAIDEE
jgi:capsid protein